MIMPQAINWFAIQTRVGAERAAEIHLGSLGMETLLPLARRLIHHATRAPRAAMRPLFPGYCFVRFSPAASLRAVRYSRGVLRVVGTDDLPWAVDDSLIASIRERLDASGCVELHERSFRSGDCVRIASGPLTGWAGVFDTHLNDAERVVILIDTLQQGRVVVRRDWLELSDAA